MLECKVGAGPQRWPGLTGWLQLRGCLEADGGEISKIFVKFGSAKIALQT